MTEIELKEKMAKLVAKWKDKDIGKDDPKWWRRRADQSLYVFYKSKLNKLQKKPDIVKVAQGIFNT